MECAQPVSQVKAQMLWGSLYAFTITQHWKSGESGHAKGQLTYRGGDGDGAPSSIGADITFDNDPARRGPALLDIYVLGSRSPTAYVSLKYPKAKTGPVGTVFEPACWGSTDWLFLLGSEMLWDYYAESVYPDWSEELPKTGIVLDRVAAIDPEAVKVLLDSRVLVEALEARRQQVVLR